MAAAGTPCVAATNLARLARATYTGNLFEITSSSGAVNVASISSLAVGATCTFTEFYDHMGSPSTGNNLVVDTAYRKSPAPCGWTTLPGGLTVPIARIVPGEGYYQGTCCEAAGTVGMPQGNSSITMYMVIENNSEGGGTDGCCSQYSDSESPTGDGANGSMFGPAWSLGGEGTFGTGTGPWCGVDLENGVYMYGATPTAKYLSILTKYNSATGILTIKCGDATEGGLTTLYSGPLPAGYPGLSLEGGYSLGRGGDGSNAPVNFLEGAVVAAATTDATDDALEANIVSFYGAKQ